MNEKMQEKEEKKEKEKGTEPEKWKGSWSQKRTTTIDMVPDVQPLVGKSEDDNLQKKKVQEKMAKAKDKKDKERLRAPLKWRPYTEWFPGLPLQVSEAEIKFSKKLNLHVKTKHKICIDRERGRERLHRDRKAKAEWLELSQRRLKLNGYV